MHPHPCSRIPIRIKNPHSPYLKSHIPVLRTIPMPTPPAPSLHIALIAQTHRLSPAQSEMLCQDESPTAAPLFSSYYTPTHLCNPPVPPSAPAAVGEEAATQKPGAPPTAASRGARRPVRPLRPLRPARRGAIPTDPVQCVLGGGQWCCWVVVTG
ncbi:hypothetical protein GMDG_05590 [Pseudogymnoascus destructans 20631-21]|uniref:Uncharacterized protein n=1 Tax=Pseudogymnoascus destructans (strain ATCC MYA-4855 / 20631-21) TaxID=658429 RepID=L8FP19_PSED2|nr:hypothetical protein GMDG_05590 [Pseudogymnoascus destructans 20631-21]